MINTRHYSRDELLICAVPITCEMHASRLEGAESKTSRHIAKACEYSFSLCKDSSWRQWKVRKFPDSTSAVTNTRFEVNEESNSAFNGFDSDSNQTFEPQNYAVGISNFFQTMIIFISGRSQRFDRLQLAARGRNEEIISIFYFKNKWSLRPRAKYTCIISDNL